ncbi:MAG: response regulator, partial [Nostoc sp.]
MNAQKIKILLVDNQLDNLHFLSQILQHQGYQVQSAISGQLAINTVLASPPDLILLDVLMSEMDGYEVCQHLKANYKTQEIPIIFFGVLDELSEKINVFDLGDIDYIIQPFQTKEVLLRIQNQLTLKRLKKQLKEQNAQLQEEIQERQRVAVELNIRNKQIEEILKEIPVRDFQQINYPILWGGHLARLGIGAGETPTPQEVVEYFFIWKSLRIGQ